MAHRHYFGAGGYDSYEAEETDLIDRQYNDDRLDKAIAYLVNEGFNDRTPTYVNRVQAIDEHILRKFPAENKLFDPTLYRRLQHLVQEVQNDNELDSSLGFESDSSIEEVVSPQALYRGMDDSPIVESEEELREVPRTPARTTPPPQTKQVRFTGKDQTRTLKEEDVREKRFLYGGPDNDVEEWYKELPPILPFGENPYMEKWESMKINYDLTESAKRSAMDEKPIITNIHYDAVAGPGGFRRINDFDSGSRYKLPSDLSDVYLPHLLPDRQKVWAEILRAFNNGGPLQKTKDYVPRLVLPWVNVPDPIEPEAPKTSKGSVRAEDGGTAGTSRPSRTSAPTSQSNTASEALKTRLKRFDARRKQAQALADSVSTRPFISKASGLSSTAPPTKKTQTSKVRTSKAAPQTKSKSLAPQTLSHVEAGPSKRGPGRPRKNQDPTYHPGRDASPESSPSPVTPAKLTLIDDLSSLLPRPRRVHHRAADPTYRPSESPVTPTKRKRDDDLDYHESTKKSKKSGRPVSKHVAFAGEEAPPSRTFTPTKNTALKKGGLKKSERVSAEERELAENQTFARGKTRSKKAFKPPGYRRSIDSSK